MKNNKEKTAWTAKEQKAIDWFLKAYLQDQLPKPPFQLTPFARVTGDIFYIHLKEDIAKGPQGQRAIMGTFQDRLFKLREVCEDINSLDPIEYAAKQLKKSTYKGAMKEFHRLFGK